MLIYVIMMFVILLFIPLLSKNKDILRPEVLTSLGYLFFIVPYLLFYYFDEKYLNYLVLYNKEYKGIEFSILKYIFLSSIGLISYWIGTLLKKESKKKIVVLLNTTKIEKKVKYFLFLGLIGYFFIFYHVGGISYYIANMYKRAHMLRGAGLYMKLSIFLDFGLIVYYFYSKNSNFRKNTILIIYFLFSSLLGGRGGPLKFLACIFLYKLSKQKSKIKFLFNKKTLFLVVVISIYIILVPIIRSKNLNPNQELNLINELVKNISKLISEIKPLYVDIFIYNYFEEKELWYGSYIQDFIKSFIPSQIYSDKPPVDDGVYIWNLVLGFDVIPSIPFKNLRASSWPMTTDSIGYVNFGIVGIILYNLLKGYIAKSCYCLMKNSNYSLISFIFYFNIILTSLTNLSIVNFIGVFLINFIPFIYIFKIKLKNKKYKTPKELKLEMRVV